MHIPIKSKACQYLAAISVAGFFALTAVAIPPAWQTVLTQTVVSPAAAQWPKPKTTRWEGESGEKIVSVRVGSVNVPGLDIPDDDPRGVDIPIEIANPHHSGSPTTTRVDVHLNIKHEWLSDLVIKLTSPDGRVVTLYDRMGPHGEYLAPCSRKGLRITLIETAPESIPFDSSQCIPWGMIEGLFHTEGYALKRFNDGKPHGIWVLNISDHSEDDHGFITLADLTVASVLR